MSKYVCDIWHKDHVDIDSDDPEVLVITMFTGDAVMLKDPEKVEQLRDELNQWLEVRKLGL